MRRIIRPVTFFAIGFTATLTLGACSGMIRGVTNSFGDALGKTLATGLACGLNGALTSAEERLTVEIPNATFEAMRERLKTLPDRPTVDQNRGVLTAAEETVLGDALLHSDFDIRSAKVDRLLTMPQLEDLLLRALVTIAKNPQTSPEWSFKRIALAKDDRVKKLDPTQTVVRLQVKLPGANESAPKSDLGNNVVFCD